MSRPVRIEFAGALYHVSSKGRGGQIVFDDAVDKGAFLNILDSVVSRFGWLIHSYVLMSDHYHLVVEISDPNLSKGMRQLNGVYTQHVNRRHAQEGAIFQGRFKSILLEKKNYLLPVCRHVVTNPNRAESSSSFNSFKWSSYRALSGQVETPEFLYTEDILDHFGGPKKTAQKRYREYIKEGLEEVSPLIKRSNQVLLGSDRFLKEMQPFLRGESLVKKGPKAVKRRRSLSALFKRVNEKPRSEWNRLMKKAHVDFGYTLIDIGDHLGLHYTTVSKVINT